MFSTLDLVRGGHAEDDEEPGQREEGEEDGHQEHRPALYPPHLHSTVQHSTAQYSTVQDSTVQDGTWPAGMEQMLMAAMTRLLKAPEPMIRLDPSSSFRNPLDTIPRIVRKI